MSFFYNSGEMDGQAFIDTGIEGGWDIGDFMLVGWEG